VTDVAIISWIVVQPVGWLSRYWPSAAATMSGPCSESAPTSSFHGTFSLVGADPRSGDQPGKQMAIKQRLHILLKSLAELVLIAVTWSRTWP
jgi:hypothetical protein